ncbi:universal stress protein [Telluria mixta]|uniref:Universal stress protein n=1 Tax=Telluria mixta TaxID=34071 RepID=A0ABT2BYY7_9BURK|nr:universal stress protein [Telluria mixta]MCS0630357.1 universal stress protein [Telluria mixta]WEM94335.1 universal stress protein [Telluria mixta]
MIKTILMHVDGGPAQDSRLRAAAALASAFDAHLVGSADTGIGWPDYALITGAVAATTAGTDFQNLRAAARARLDAFDAAAGRLGVASVETRMVEDEARYALLLQSRYADLVVLSRDGRAAPGRADPAQPARARALPEYVALHGARPVLVVPPEDADQPLPGTAVVGWDGSMQAIAAIIAALPLLVRADGVRLALVNPDTLSDLHGEQPGADIALYLARHGARVDVVVERTRSTVGTALLGLARDCGAGLMVTGAYGHSRYREGMVGGVTRELLEKSRVPLLLAH